ncbi:hypothetical protein PIB30_030456 [Stylosanthes scabra]|uniref:Uncharacterized protein n=1 Tax=Stylosanthes scabra TaxID=79078 RepID=A0ABU6TBA7_9FABA|nr:hypothetical protein [Stylosanthes scabra]
MAADQNREREAANIEEEHKLNFRPKIERKSPREAKKNKESKESGQKAKNSPIQSLPRACALPYLMRKFPLVARPRDPDGAPAPPHFITPKTRTPAAELT